MYGGWGRIQLGDGLSFGLSSVNGSFGIGPTVFKVQLVRVSNPLDGSLTDSEFGSRNLVTSVLFGLKVALFEAQLSFHVIYAQGFPVSGARGIPAVAGRPSAAWRCQSPPRASVPPLTPPGMVSPRKLWPAPSPPLSLSSNVTCLGESVPSHPGSFAPPCPALSVPPFFVFLGAASYHTVHRVCYLLNTSISSFQRMNCMRPGLFTLLTSVSPAATAVPGAQ